MINCAITFKVHSKTSNINVDQLELIADDELFGLRKIKFAELLVELILIIIMEKL